MNTYINNDGQQSNSDLQLHSTITIPGCHRVYFFNNGKIDSKNKLRPLLKQTNIPYANAASNPATWKTQFIQFIFLIKHCTVQIGNLKHKEPGSLILPGRFME